MSTRSRLLILFIFLLSVNTYGAYSIQPPATKSLNESEVFALETQLLTLVNRERRKAKLPLFTLDSAMSNVSRKHSYDMAMRDFFSHKNKQGQSPFDRMRQAGINFQAAAENIAYASEVLEIHKNLMNSPGHRANIMNPRYNKIGIGIVPFKYGLMTTQLFTN